MKTSAEFEAYKILKQCPKFIICSAPICPLDLFNDSRIKLPGELECSLSKNKRLKIAKGSSLPFQGLTKREFAAKNAWNELSEPDKAKRRSKLRLKGPIRSISSRNLNPNQKSDTKIPVIENQFKNPEEK